MPDRRAIASLGRAGRDLLIRTAALRAALVLAVVVATQIGDDDLAAFQVVFQIWNLLALILDAIAIAAQAMVAKALGAGDERVADRWQRADRLEHRVGRRARWRRRGAADRVPHVFSDDEAVVALVAFRSGTSPPSNL